MSWIWAALMPHPPVIVPEVGRGREKDAGKTLFGLKALERNIRKVCATPETAPDCLLILSPHHTAAPGALFLNSAHELHGSLLPFGAPQVAFNLSTPQESFEALVQFLREQSISVAVNADPDITRDHGSLVPLYYLAKCMPGGKLPPVIMANPLGLGPRGALRLGQALRQFKHQERWAFLASGDLSHRLKPQAPAGYHDDGKVFDRIVIKALQQGDAAALVQLESAVRKNAAECGLCSVMTLLGLTQGPVQVFSYEGPFGVGYCNAFWVPSDKAGAEQSVQPPAAVKEQLMQHVEPYPFLAREVIKATLEGKPVTEDLWAHVNGLAATEELWSKRAGCFVSIKTKKDALRGCMGTILATQTSLGQEIIANAIMASTRDPRFPPMTANELDNVVISVDVLSDPEPIASEAELDPKKWGVIVTKGVRRGLLLPDLDGVNTVEQQLKIASQKAGLSGWDGASLQRFSVTRFKEKS